MEFQHVVVVVYVIADGMPFLPRSPEDRAATPLGVGLSVQEPRYVDQAHAERGGFTTLPRTVPFAWRVPAAQGPRRGQAQDQTRGRQVPRQPLRRDCRPQRVACRETPRSST